MISHQVILHVPAFAKSLQHSYVVSSTIKSSLIEPSHFPDPFMILGGHGLANNRELVQQRNKKKILHHEAGKLLLVDDLNCPAITLFDFHCRNSATPCFNVQCEVEIADAKARRSIIHAFAFGRPMKALRHDAAPRGNTTTEDQAT